MNPHSGERLLLFVAPSAKFFLSHRAPIGSAAIADGYRVVVACPHDGDCAQLAAQGFMHRPIPLSRSGVSPALEVRSLAALYRLLRRERPTVCHLITAKPALHGGIAARLTGTPTLTAVTGLGFLFTKQGWRARMLQRALLLAYRYGLRRADNVFVFQNQDDRETFRRFGLLDRSDHVMLPGSGVDLDRISPAPPPETTRPLVVMPSRMLGDKGVGEFVAAARHLRARGSSARFRLVGDPDPENPTSLTPAALTEIAAEGVVDWQPFTPDIGAALAEASVVALPSYREGFPKTLIDAAAAGRPMVATDVPGCRDAVIDGTTGLLCRARDASSLADALEKLINAPALRKQMGAAARQDAVARFDIRNVVAAHLEIYRRIARDS